MAKANLIAGYQLTAQTAPSYVAFGLRDRQCLPRSGEVDPAPRCAGEGRRGGTALAEVMISTSVTRKRLRIVSNPR